MRRIILASSSPRRAALLRQIGLEFTVEPSGVGEGMDERLTPAELALSLSAAKAAGVAAANPGALVIAADTLVVLEGRALGKPASPQEAGAMLRSLAGKAHTVVTGLTIAEGGSGKAASGTVETRVHVRPLSDGEIEAYVRSGEPLDKAGAYGIQGLGAAIVERIEGDYSNVVGLPLFALAGALRGFGVDVLAGQGEKGCPALSKSGT